MSASVLPNLLVIVSDTFRQDHLGAYGNPHKDALSGRAGALFCCLREPSAVLLPNHACAGHR